MKRLLLPVLGALALLFPAYATAATGLVEGTVTPLAWAQEVEVCVLEAQPSETCTTPLADGSYTLVGVPLSGAGIEFLPSYRSSLLDQYYDHKSTASEATPITFPSGKAPTLSGVDADLVEGGVLEGTVTAADGGAPLAEVEVCATGGPSRRKRCDETDAAGEYELHSLETGAYAVSFFGGGRSDEYQPAYHPGVEVTAGATTNPVDATLSKGGQIRGAVSAAMGGAPLGGIAVCLFAVGVPTPERCTASDSFGAYGFVGLPSGSYQVGFSLEAAEVGDDGGFAADGYQSQYFDGVSDRAAALTLSLLAPASVTQVNAALAASIFVPLPSPAPPAQSTTSSVPIVPEPSPNPPKARCGKGHKIKKVKGKRRCVKQRRHKRVVHKKHSRHRRRKVGHSHRGA